jgi:hypothetical protein
LRDVTLRFLCSTTGYSVILAELHLTLEAFHIELLASTFIELCLLQTSLLVAAVQL